MLLKSGMPLRDRCSGNEPLCSQGGIVGKLLSPLCQRGPCLQRRLCALDKPKPGAPGHPGVVMEPLDLTLEHAAKDVEVSRLRLQGVPTSSDTFFWTMPIRLGIVDPYN